MQSTLQSMWPVLRKSPQNTEAQATESDTKISQSASTTCVSGLWDTVLRVAISWKWGIRVASDGTAVRRGLLRTLQDTWREVSVIPRVGRYSVQNPSIYASRLMKESQSRKVTIVYPLCVFVFVSAMGCSTDAKLAQNVQVDTSTRSDPAQPTVLDQDSSTTKELSERDDQDLRELSYAKAWPNWMGPRHNGISEETGWSSDWPQAGLSFSWTQQIGIGFSSVTIDRGRLFSMGHTDGIETVYCLNAETGKPLWTKSYPSSLVDNLHEGGPGATPTIYGDHVYTLGRGGQLHCLDVETGNVVWSQSLEDDLQVTLPEWGFTASPYILGDQLILEAGRVVSYDRSTGRKNWQTDRHAAGYGSAISFDLAGETFIATLDCDGLRIILAVDGKPVDTFDWVSPFATNSTTPIVQGNLIYISTGYDVGCGLFRFVGRKLELIYSNGDMRNHFNNSILLEGNLYGFDGNSNLGRVVQLTCQNFESGEIMWKKRGMGCGSLIVADGKLLILSEKGDLVVAEATPNGYNELSRMEFLDGRCWTTPTIWNCRVYGRNAQGKLVCVELPAIGS